MGYQLNSLANLPIDAEVNFYIFVINGQWKEPVYSILNENFSAIARSIGNNAVIAMGLNPQEWYDEVAAGYLSKDHNELFNLLPAVLITNAHPDRITESSLRLLVPLRDVEARFGGWPQFFASLSDFVQLKNDGFLNKFQPKEDFIDVANKVVNLRPGMFGVSVNINELITWWKKRRSGPCAPDHRVEC